jgi:hypothetical protein
MPVDGVAVGPASNGGEGGRIDNWEDLPQEAKDRLYQAQFIGIKMLTDEQVNQAFRSSQGS